MRMMFLLFYLFIVSFLTFIFFTFVSFIFLSCFILFCFLIVYKFSPPLPRFVFLFLIFSISSSFTNDCVALTTTCCSLLAEEGGARGKRRLERTKNENKNCAR
uniref:(northern house mosquito) hypothetical protein n=1 Tax=Culex pipiens TaxID=7175 RepID=A0A8D8D3K7_CULPI